MGTPIQVSAITTKSVSLKTYSPNNFKRTLRSVSTVGKALEAKSISLGRLKKIHGEEKLEALIKVYLIDLNESLNLKRSLTERQIDDCAFEIVDQYPNLTVADLYLIMRRAKTGYYGTFYESINMAKIMTWFSDYFSERCSEAARLNYEKHLSHKEDIMEDRFSETIGLVNMLKPVNINKKIEKK